MRALWVYSSAFKRLNLASFYLSHQPGAACMPPPAQHMQLQAGASRSHWACRARVYRAIQRAPRG
eukprot:3828563-Prymnesium_polylepis.2